MGAMATPAAMIRALRWAWLALCVASGAMLLPGCASMTAGTQRSTPWGPVIGSDDSAATGTLAWKGVPFARAPVGALRWRAPQDPQPWSAPRRATAFAPACVQTARLYSPGDSNGYDASIGSNLGKTVGDEDCLYLNVWAPAAPSDRPRPVIVFVHGGSNITGYTADPVYDGAALARAEDAVVVSVAHRLGVFGFLELGALKTGQRDEDSGNFALLDLIKALEFVQAGAAAFGGDPGRVTLMGQSSGAVNVYALLTSPLLVARPGPPLFHRVVALSGGISTAATLPKGGIPGVLPLPVWKTRGEALLLEAMVAAGLAADEPAARALLPQRSAAQWSAWLRERSPDAVLSVVRGRLTARGMQASNPIPDGWVLATDPIAAIRAGRYVRVPVLAGHTRDETKLFPQLFALRLDLGGTSGRLLDDAAVFARVSRYDPEAPPQTRIEDWVPAAYLPAQASGTGFDARAAELDRLWFSAIRNDVLDALRSQQPDVWAYEFEWRQLPPPFDVVFGAAHTFDLPFVFGNFGPSLYSRISFTRANAPGRLALSRAMQASLGAFARSGDPNAPELQRPWAPWPGRIVFDADAQRARIGGR